MSRLSAHGNGIWSKHWTVGLNDRGFAKPEPSSYFISGVWLALIDVMNNRLAGPTLSWSRRLRRCPGRGAGSVGVRVVTKGEKAVSWLPMGAVTLDG